MGPNLSCVLKPVLLDCKSKGINKTEQFIFVKVLRNISENPRQTGYPFNP
jgi:hypothetical protein